jgi:hypothetical protein
MQFLSVSKNKPSKEAAWLAVALVFPFSFTLPNSSDAITE